MSILLSIAFATLRERKLLRLAQIRKGPEMVGPIGTLQPISDGLKLIIKREILWNSEVSILIVPGVLLFFIFMF